MEVKRSGKVECKVNWDALSVAEIGWKDKVLWKEYGLQGIGVGREF